MDKAVAFFHTNTFWKGKNPSFKPATMSSYQCKFGSLTLEGETV